MQFQSPLTHYWAVYHQHNGWLPNADATRREAWLLGKLVRGWPAALGLALHARAAECIVACRSRAPLPAPAELRRRCARDLNALYIASQSRVLDFRRSPKRWPVLAAAYYGEPFDGDDLSVAVTRLDGALDRLIDCALWPAIRTAEPNDVVVVDPFHAFTLAIRGETPAVQVRVYAAPDIVLRRSPDGPTELWDFKLGRADAVDQLFVYALALRISGLVVPNDRRNAGNEFVGGVVRLGAPPGAADDSFEIDLADINATVARISHSVAAMRAPLADVARNEPDVIDAFPRTESRHRCPTCVYRGLCEPERYAFGGRATASRGYTWAHGSREVSTLDAAADDPSLMAPS